MRVYDVGEYVVSGKDEVRFPFVIADYLPRTLRDSMRAGLWMTEKMAFALQMVSALSYLDSHAPSIVHRDIKPENIFVRGKACILGDFGLMKFVGDGDIEADKKFMIESTGVRLPYFYRTPDLVNYCRNVGTLSARSDVFQIGLVFAEMFSGVNPLKKCKDILDPVELNELTQIPCSRSLAVALHAYLQRMLDFDAGRRISPEELFDPLEGLFLQAVSASLDLEGKVF